MSVVIPDEILEASRMTAEELRQEIAVLLFEKGKLTLAQASRMAGMERLRFQHLLAARKIPVHYGTPELEQDLAVLRKLDSGWALTCMRGRWRRRVGRPGVRPQSAAASGGDQLRRLAR